MANGRKPPRIAFRESHNSEGEGEAISSSVLGVAKYLNKVGSIEPNVGHFHPSPL